MQNIFSHNLRVRFSEVDLHGHVFNINYILYFEIAIGEYLRSLEIKWFHNDAPSNMSFYVRKTDIEYLSPIYFDQNITIKVQITRVGNTSITFSGEIYLEEGVLAATAQTVWVCVDKVAHCKIALPTEFKHILEAL